MQIAATAATSGNPSPPAGWSQSDGRPLAYEREIALFSLPGSISKLLRRGGEAGSEANRLPFEGIAWPPAYLFQQS
jgi:hypothetical protein